MPYEEGAFKPTSEGDQKSKPCATWGNELSWLNKEHYKGPEAAWAWFV